MHNQTFVGLDIHRKSIVATALDPEGQLLDQTTLGTRDQELVDYLRRLGGQPSVVMEACSVWEHVYDAASTVAARVELARPYKVRVISEASLKSDKVDSRALAELLRLNAIPKSYAPEKPIRELRQLVRDRRHLKHLQTAIKNHIYATLLRKGIEYEDGVLGLKRKRETLRLLKLAPVNRGLDLLKEFEDRCHGLDEAVHDEFGKWREAQLLRSIPGIGELTAVTLVAELCPITRFANAEKVCSYAGLVPTNHQSGETSYQGRLKKDCDEVLKEVLVEASWTHRRFAKTSDATKIGRRVARRRGPGKGACAAAHKLLKIVYVVLKRGTPYTPERPSRERGAAASATAALV